MRRASLGQNLREQARYDWSRLLLLWATVISLIYGLGLMTGGDFFRAIPSFSLINKCQPFSVTSLHSLKATHLLRLGKCPPGGKYIICEKKIPRTLPQVCPQLPPLQLLETYLPRQFTGYSQARGFSKMGGWGSW